MTSENKVNDPKRFAIAFCDYENVKIYQHLIWAASLEDAEKIAFMYATGEYFPENAGWSPLSLAMKMNCTFNVLEVEWMLKSTS